MENSGTFDIGSNKIETGIGPTVDGIINFLMKKIEMDKISNKIGNRILYPVLDIINKKIRSYVYIGIGMYLAIIILLIVIIYFLMKLYRKSI